jgi:hypothetical protein
MKIKKILALVCAAATIGFTATSCSDDDDNNVTPLSIVTFEDATLNADGILREETFIEEDDYELGDFWAAYTEKGIAVRSYVATSMGYPFWCGFEVSNNTDMTTEG